MSKENQETSPTEQPIQSKPPKTPLEALAGIAHATFPGSKIIVLVDTPQGSFQMAGVNLMSGADRIGMIEAARIIARVEFSQGIGIVPTVQNEMKSST